MLRTDFLSVPTNSHSRIEPKGLSIQLLLIQLLHNDYYRSVGHIFFIRDTFHLFIFIFNIYSTRIKSIYISNMMLFGET